MFFLQAQPLALQREGPRRNTIRRIYYLCPYIKSRYTVATEARCLSFSLMPCHGLSYRGAYKHLEACAPHSARMHIHAPIRHTVGPHSDLPYAFNMTYRRSVKRPTAGL